MADRLILNKTDLVSKEELEILEADIREMNGVAQIVRAQHSKVDLSFVLDISAFDPDRVKDLDPPVAADDHVHDEHCGHEHQITESTNRHIDQVILGQSVRQGAIALTFGFSNTQYSTLDHLPTCP